MLGNDRDVLLTHTRYGLQTPEGVIHWDSYRLDENVFSSTPTSRLPAKFCRSPRFPSLLVPSVIPSGDRTSDRTYPVPRNPLSPANIRGLLRMRRSRPLLRRCPSIPIERRGTLSHACPGPRQL